MVLVAIVFDFEVCGLLDFGGWLGLLLLASIARAVCFYGVDWWLYLIALAAFGFVVRS